MGIRIFGALGLTVAVVGCAGTEGVYRVENATGQSIPSRALADTIFLDGTGPSARMLARGPSTQVGGGRGLRPQEIATPATGGVRPTAIEAADTAPSTTGSTGNVRDAKSFHEWVEDEKRQDARMRTIMNICRGC